MKPTPASPEILAERQKARERVATLHIAMSEARAALAGYESQAAVARGTALRATAEYEAALKATDARWWKAREAEAVNLKNEGVGV